MAVLEAWLAGSEAWLAGSEAWQAGLEGWVASRRAGGLAGGGRMDGRMNKRMDGWKISPFYRTLSPIGASGPLQPNFNLETV